MDIIERLRFDAARCEQQFSKGVAGNIEEAAAEIERLRAALKQALRQWHMYAEMVERTEGYDLAKEQSPEGDIYRATYAVAHEGTCKSQSNTPAR